MLVFVPIGSKDVRGPGACGKQLQSPQSRLLEEGGVRPGTQGLLEDLPVLCFGRAARHRGTRLQCRNDLVIHVPNRKLCHGASIAFVRFQIDGSEAVWQTFLQDVPLGGDADMTWFEIILSTGTVATTVAGIFYIARIARTSGRDRPSDPARVNAMVKAAPLHRLDRVLSK